MLHVFITDLLAYNKGHLAGKWVELPISRFELAQALSEVLNEGESISGLMSHEEIFIADYEWDLYNLFDIEKYMDIHELNQLTIDLDMKADTELKALSFLLEEGLALDIADAISKAGDVVIHEDQTMSDVAYELLHDCYNLEGIASIITNNIDYEAVANELEIDGSYWTVGHDIFEYIG